MIRREHEDLVRWQETTNLDYDHRQRVYVGLDGGSLLLPLVREHIEELWSGPTDRTPTVWR